MSSAQTVANRSEKLQFGIRPAAEPVDACLDAAFVL